MLLEIPLWILDGLRRETISLSAAILTLHCFSNW